MYTYEEEKKFWTDINNMGSKKVTETSQYKTQKLTYSSVEEMRKDRDCISQEEFDKQIASKYGF